MAAHRRNLATTFLNLTALFWGGTLARLELAAVQAEALLETLVAGLGYQAQPGTAGQGRGVAGEDSDANRRHDRGGRGSQARRELYENVDPGHRSGVGSDADLSILAWLETSKNASDADTSWREAAGLSERLVAKAPKRLDLRSDLAYNVMQRGLSSRRLGRNAEAERDLRRAVELLQGVVSEAPERTGDRYRLAQAAHYFGHFLFGLQRSSESEAFTASLQLFERTSDSSWILIDRMTWSRRVRTA